MFLMMLFMMFLVLLVLLFLSSIFQCLNLLPDLLHFKRIFKNCMTRLHFLLLYIDHWILHHPQKSLVFISCERVMGLLRLESRFLSGGLFIRQTFNCLSKKKLFRVLSTLGLLLCCSAVLIHPVQPLKRALWNDALLDLNEFEVLNLLLLFELLDSFGMPMLLFFFLGLCQPDFFNVWKR